MRDAESEEEGELWVKKSLCGAEFVDGGGGGI